MKAHQPPAFLVETAGRIGAEVNAIWLAQHDRGVAAKALRDAAEALARPETTPLATFDAATVRIVAWLNRRADRIEATS